MYEIFFNRVIQQRECCILCPPFDFLHYISGMYRIILPMLLLLSIAACKKDPETKDIPLQDFTFSNRLTESVTVDIYSKTDDYNNAANPMMTFKIDAQGKHTIPGSSFTKGQEYYTDWYTDGYTVSNWPYNAEHSRYSPELNHMTIMPSKNSSYIIYDYPAEQVLRKALINNNGTQTTWQTLNTPPNETITLTFARNHTVSYTQNGHTESRTFSASAATLYFNKDSSLIVFGIKDSVRGLPVDTPAFVLNKYTSNQQYLLVKVK